MNNNYEILNTIFENDFQRITQCKDKDTNQIFINNVIFNSGLIELIDVDVIKTIFNSIIDVYKTEDRVYIYSEPCTYEKFTDFISNNELTLKQQFNLTEQIINLGAKISELSDLLQFTILKYDNLYIDDKKNLIIDCKFIFDQPYDISDNITLKRLGDIIHYLFAKETIVDYNVSETIPPDILKIVVRCLTKEYSSSEEALEDLLKSHIYTLINPIIFDEPKKIIDEKEIQGITNDELNDENQDIPELNKEDDSKLSKVSIALIILVIVIPLVFLGYRRLNSTPPVINPGDDNETETPVDNNEQEDNTTGSSVNGDNGDSDLPETINEFFNSDLLEKIDYNGQAAVVDYNVFYDGFSSLLLENSSDEKIKFLFAVIDINDENYSYLKNRQIGLSVRIKSEKDTEGVLIVEVYENGQISTNQSNKINIYDDVWSLEQVIINSGNIDRIDVYLEYSGANKIWVDNIEIDVLK